MLIGIGYLLRVPLFQWLIGEFKTSFFVIDVLQCIGLSLILIVVIYRLTCKKTLLFSILMLLFSTSKVALMLSLFWLDAEKQTNRHKINEVNFRFN